MSGFRTGALADLEGLKARHAAAFAANWRARLTTIAVIGVLGGLLVFGFAALGFSFAKIAAGLGRLVEFVGLMVPPTSGTFEKFLSYLRALGETVAIAFLGTLLAAILAFPFGFLAARNVVPNAIFHFSIRRGLDSIRGVDTLIWALIWINVVGLGPFAGILALMTSDFGTFGKLFSEAIEAADRKPVEGVASTGGGALAGVRFGLVPQILPVIASQVLYYFESNTRSATIIGVVGAGGIGLHLYEQIKILEWQHVSFLILMVLATVAIIDFVSTKLRFAIIGRAQIAV